MPTTLATPRDIAFISLGLPALAWGLLGLSVPMIVHLILRERPRREVFPAMRFLLASHTLATRSHRIRHLLLLLCRLALIAIVVGILGRVGCTRDGATSRLTFAAGAPGPASVVICVDTSASMGYRYQGRTRVQAAIDWAGTLLSDPRQFGHGSQFAFVTGTPAAGTNQWRDDPRAITRLLETAQPAYHSLGVAPLLSQAYTLLAAARHARREVYIFTDLTESSWADACPPPPPTLTGVFIMDVGQDENRNVVLGIPRVPPYRVAAGVPLNIPVRISSGDLPAEPVVEFSIDGRPRGRQSAGPLTADDQTELALNLPALEPGPHGLQVDMEPTDALGCDNRRFAWLIAGDLPRIGLIQAGTRDEVARMLRAMIAPPAVPASEHRYNVEPVPIDALLSRNLDNMPALILADVKTLNGLAVERLTAYTSSGGTLIIMPGPNTAADTYPAAATLLPAAIDRVAVCEPPLRPAAANLTHSWLEPFTDLTIDSINDRLAFQRIVLKPAAAGATVVLSFADGSPALIESRAGKGRVVLFAFSVAADWGQFGTQAAPMIVLLHRILELAQPPMQNLAALIAGPVSPRAIPDAANSPLLVHAADGRDLPVAPISAQTYRLPSDLPQNYQAAAKPDQKRPVLYYSVNVAPAESQPRRISVDQVREKVDRNLTSVLSPGNVPAHGSAGVQARISWVVPLALALALLLTLESAFANRFYKSSGH